MIVIGEIRDRETMQHAMAYAETGHLCIPTLHANNANQTIKRILNFYLDSTHSQLLMDLSMNLHSGMRSINRTPCAEPPNEMRIQVCG